MNTRINYSQPNHLYQAQVATAQIHRRAMRVPYVLSLALVLSVSQILLIPLASAAAAVSDLKALCSHQDVTLKTIGDLQKLFDNLRSCAQAGERFSVVVLDVVETMSLILELTLRQWTARDALWCLLMELNRGDVQIDRLNT